MSTIEQAFQVALSTRKRAHAPYSKFKVGSAVKFKNNDSVFSGCNVENASFGGTICAERTAITKAVSESDQRELEYIVVVTDTEPAQGPCGICLQFICEFSTDDTVVHIANPSGIQKTVKFKELLPLQFSKSSL